jgi:hypothetical protein
MAAEPKDNASFFRKVVRFVANPTTEWTDIQSPLEDGRDLGLEKSELKAMVERKRRNDFVRKREFDVLRKVRREGLTPEQLAALGSSSRLDDSEGKMSENALRQESGVKDKIDHIEREMVGDTAGYRAGARPPGFFDAPTQPAVLARNGIKNTRQGGLDPLARSAPPDLPSLDDDADQLPALPPLLDVEDTPAVHAPGLPAGLGPLAHPPNIAAQADLPVLELPSELPASRLRAHEVESPAFALDPELDEPVIAFANADFTQCETQLQQLVGAGGVRERDADTWLVLFDLYRATGQHQRFESLALDFAQRFATSAPQWISLPKLAAEATAAERPRQSPPSSTAGWICPEILDIEAVGRLRAETMKWPLPWVFDWAGVRSVDAEAATQLSALMRVWAGQTLEMQWIGGEQLFGALAEAAPTGVRDADPSFWLARLDALRLANRADQFDETAIDYCVTYEVSPPSWEPTRCKVRVHDAGMSTRPSTQPMVASLSTQFEDSAVPASGSGVALVELSGQLAGDIGSTLERMRSDSRDAPLVKVSCARLMRVDFIAAGDLLNWVLLRRQENRAVEFVEAHRLVALFFGAMGINEHAKVTVRRQ